MKKATDILKVALAAAEQAEAAEQAARQTPAPSPVSLLTYADFAARLGVSVRSVKNWTAAGRLHAVRPGPRTVRIPESEIARLTVGG